MVKRKKFNLRKYKILSNNENVYIRVIWAVTHVIEALFKKADHVKTKSEATRERR